MAPRQLPDVPFGRLSKLRQLLAHMMTSSDHPHIGKIFAPCPRDSRTSANLSRFSTKSSFAAPSLDVEVFRGVAIVLSFLLASLVPPRQPINRPTTLQFSPSWRCLCYDDALIVAFSSLRILHRQPLNPTLASFWRRSMKESLRLGLPMVFLLGQFR